MVRAIAVPLRRGSSLSIEVIVCGERCYVREYLDGLQPPERKKLFRLLETSAENGTPSNKQKFRRLKGEGSGLYEFKSYQDRLIGTMEGNRVILTHGFQKQDDDTDPEQIKRAWRIVGLYRS
jgi:mRNA-degrading endonuclease RelE of RelBE toxin-antitoxin system